MSTKFAALAAKVGSRDLAGWITQHNPKVRARAMATRARKRTAREVMKAAGGSKSSY